MAADDEKLEEELAKRWDPERLSKFLKMREGKAERLDLTTRQKYEKRFGVDLGDVRIFTGTLAEEITAAHGAEALTVADSNMVLMGGSTKFAKGSAAGEALLAHELTHVAQAKPGMIQRKAVSSAPLATEESEAEAEAQEAQELAAQQGGASDTGVDTAKMQRDAERREKIMKRVIELFEEEVRISGDRGGTGYL